MSGCTCEYSAFGSMIDGLVHTRQLAEYQGIEVPRSSKFGVKHKPLAFLSGYFMSKGGECWAVATLGGVAET